MARRSDLHIAPGESRGQRRRDGRRFPFVAHPSQALVVTVQAPDVLAVLQATPDAIVKPKVGAVDLFGLLQLSLLQQ